MAIDDDTVYVPRWTKKDNQYLSSFFCGAVEITLAVGIAQLCENSVMYALPAVFALGGLADMLGGRPASLLHGIDALAEKYAGRNASVSGAEGNSENQ
jgi:hypothetical protein